MAKNLYQSFLGHLAPKSEAEAITFCFLGFIIVNKLLSQTWGDKDPEKQNIILKEISDQIRKMSDVKEKVVWLIEYSTNQQSLFVKAWSRMDDEEKRTIRLQIVEHIKECIGNYHFGGNN